MRRISLLLALMLSSSPAHADVLLPGDPFTPESVLIELSQPLFGNGTNMFCWQCDDASTANDLQLVLDRGAPFYAAGFPDFFTAGSLGSISVNGDAPDFEGLDVSFSFQVTTTVTTKVNDDNSFEDLPRPSVATGTITGGVIGIGGRDLVLQYSGRVGGVTFLESSIDPFPVPPGGDSKSLTAEIFVDPSIPYSPAGPGPTPTVTPEPASLLLMGSAFVAAAFKARRSARRPRG
jgi:hypothetical protein